ncbi:hypothetical protein GN956_G11485 [Arapaima gigas]
MELWPEGSILQAAPGGEGKPPLGRRRKLWYPEKLSAPSFSLQNTSCGDISVDPPQTPSGPSSSFFDNANRTKGSLQDKGSSLCLRKFW